MEYHEICIPVCLGEIKWRFWFVIFVFSTVEEIHNLLDKSQYRKALSLLKAAMDSFPDYQLFIDPAPDR